MARARVSVMILAFGTMYCQAVWRGSNTSPGLEPNNLETRSDDDSFITQLPKLVTYASADWRHRLEDCASGSGSQSESAGNNFPAISKEEIDFIAIPKAGTTSISKWFGLPHEHWTARQKQDRNATKYSHAKFRFAIVRNPFARMFSWYHFCICSTDRSIPGPGSFCKRALKHSALAGEDQHLGFQNWMKFWVAKVQNYWVTTPMKEWITNDEGKIDVDFFVRVENMKEDTEKLMCMTGLEMEVDHSIENPSTCDATRYLSRVKQYEYTLKDGADVSKITDLLARPHEDYHEFYDAETEKIVRDLMQPDLDYFGYEF
mmetsp:Transcript_19147/g.34208  ORF Transcript_19147/g.34208 Transcript_19147/m.34208 type:complete len:317 (-) Transcript_19147:122-1072(-)|eukprot:CAMPEP_0197536576 /NCGR_PEP_ID=MMETSP1318-20131121/54247_1 /TAXON_ID=552666 /ORGANISM="Partenskyella glossopodia, Strain RCC365" /LENGTH=316 /DNA_ID=CAMNT_0043094497 /DNA_START=89 /DNA_END=1039 /DNA_ORIENTATION=-